MGKVTEQLSAILKTPKSELVGRVTSLLQQNSIPPANITITYVNGKIYIHNNFNVFNLTDNQKTELMRCMLGDAINNLKQTESQNKSELEQVKNECDIGCDCYTCNNSEILGNEQ